MLISVTNRTIALLLVSSQAFGTLLLGEAISLEKSISLKDLKAQIPTKEIVLKGMAVDLDKKSGSWITVKSEDDSIKVRFNELSFSAPPKVQGKTILVLGHVRERALTQREVVDYLKRLGPDTDPIRVKAPKRELEIMATALEIVD